MISGTENNILLIIIISGTDNKCIEGVMFAGWGSHTDHTRAAYLTAAAAIGMTQLDLERFIKRLEKVEIMILLLLPSGPCPYRPQIYCS